MNDCIFCKIANKEIPSNFLYEDDDVFAIMDINPICDGHVLVIPKMHYEDVTMVSDEVFCKMRKIALSIGKELMDITGEKGYTLSINYGDKQEVKHLHMHVMPNFKISPKKDYMDIYNEYIKRTSNNDVNPI